MSDRQITFSSVDILQSPCSAMFEKLLVKYHDTFQLAITNVNNGISKTCTIIITSLIKDRMKDMNQFNGDTATKQVTLLWTNGFED